MATVMITHCSSCPCQGMGVATPFINAIVPSHACDSVCWEVQKQMQLKDVLRDRDHQILLLQNTRLSARWKWKKSAGTSIASCVSYMPATHGIKEVAMDAISSLMHCAHSLIVFIWRTVPAQFNLPALLDLAVVVHVHLLNLPYKQPCTLLQLLVLISAWTACYIGNLLAWSCIYSC